MVSAATANRIWVGVTFSMPLDCELLVIRLFLQPRALMKHNISNSIIALLNGYHPLGQCSICFPFAQLFLKTICFGSHFHWL